MKYYQKKNDIFVFYLFCSFLLLNATTFLYAEKKNQNEDIIKNDTTFENTQKINRIIISGNNHLPDSAIRTFVPYKVGTTFNPILTRTTINNLYFGLPNRFKNISIGTEIIDDQLLNVHIIIEEKNPLKHISITGNKHLSEKDILEKTDIQNMFSIDENDLPTIAKKIQNLYLQKGYHQTDIETEFVLLDECAQVFFKIHEGTPAVVKQIHFIGNECISDKELRSVLLTKEEWLLSFLDKAGQYHPERLQADKHFLQQYYQNRGFPHARVIDIDVCINKKNEIILTFEIEEGSVYHFKDISVTGNEICNEAFLKSNIPLYPGMIYSREAIVASIKQLESLWGNFGYIFAHVEPAVDINDKDKTVSVRFFSDIGNKINLHCLTIRGNQKTRDKIIRRRLVVSEGLPLTQLQMDVSQRNVESLGFFKPKDGVLWKIKRLNDNAVDLDLIVQEARTGHFGAQFGFGGANADFKSAASGLNFSIDLSDTNLFGSGIHLNTTASWSKDEQTIAFHLAQPWLFDKPILGAIDIYHKRPTYDELHHLDIPAVHEKLTGGSTTIGYITRSNHQLIHDIHALCSVGINNSRYQTLPKAFIPGASQEINAEYQTILDKEFSPGSFLWFSGKLEQDTRNHPIHTSRGHNWRLMSKVAVPSFGDNIGFYKLSFDWSWFTSLINEYDLILRIHTFAGITAPLKNRTVPFGELFHIGGHNTVRGFLFGQIGPKFQGDNIGAKKALFCNVELVFPIAGDLSMKGVIFYDGGAGFDNPYASLVSSKNIMSNNFDYRHSIGFGLRLLRPMPIKIDWGFKIDPRKNKRDPRRSETAHEVHFGMSYDW